MRRTWRLRPSPIVSSIQLVGSALRNRMGGSRGHNHCGSSTRRAEAGKVLPSLSTTPLRSFDKAAAPGSPSTWTK